MNGSRQGFSLIEVTIAIAIVTLIITTTLAVLSQGMTASRGADQHTKTGLIVEDAQGRLSGQPLVEGTLPISPLFYSVAGEFIAPDADERKKSARFYRVDLQLVKPADDQRPKDAPGLMAVLMELVWPLDSQTGEPAGPQTEKSHHTFLVNPLTGPDWTEIDSSYQPKIEF